MFRGLFSSDGAVIAKLLQSFHLPLEPDVQLKKTNNNVSLIAKQNSIYTTMMNLTHNTKMTVRYNTL